MAIGFERIPASIRVPLFYAEITNRLAGYQQNPQPALIIGPKLAGTPGKTLTPLLMSSFSQAVQAFGAGSIIADMVDFYRRGDTFGELWAIALDDAVGSVQATGRLSVEGSPTVAGTIPLYIGGDLVRIAVAAGASPDAVSQAIVDAVTASPFSLVNASLTGKQVGWSYDGSDATKMTVVLNTAASDTIDWGDGSNVETASGNSLSHKYATSGVYTIHRQKFGPPVSTVLLTVNVPDSGLAESASDVLLTARAAGELGNEIDIRLAYRDLVGGELVPPGLGIFITPMDGGAGVPDIQPALDAMADDEYDFIAEPYTDGASLDAIGDAMNDVTGRWAWDRQIYGHVFTAKMGTAQELHDFGKTRNDQHVSVLGFAPSPTPAWRRAAALAAQAAVSLRIDPARPLQTLPLVDVLAPNRTTAFRLNEKNTLLYSGIATEKINTGQVEIERCVTTYQKNVWGQSDPSYLDVTTLATLQYFVRFMRGRILQKFPRHKLANDGTAFGPGQAIVTPRIIRAELIAAYSELVEVGIVEDIEAYKQLLIVERNRQDPNRVDVLASPDLVNQLRILAALVAFRLQAEPVPQAA